MATQQDEPNAHDEDVLSLSFLDVLCCGLGAAIYLFLVFSVMPHIGVAGLPETTQLPSGGIDAVNRRAGVRLDTFDPVAVAPVHINVHLAGVSIEIAQQLEFRWEGFRSPVMDASGPYLDESDGRVTFRSPETIGKYTARSIGCTVLDPAGALVDVIHVTVEIIAGGVPRKLAGNVSFTGSEMRLFVLDVLQEPAEWVKETATGLEEIAEEQSES